MSEFNYIEPKDNTFDIDELSKCLLNEDMLKVKLDNGEYWSNTEMEPGCYYAKHEGIYVFVDEDVRKFEECKFSTRHLLSDSEAVWFKINRGPIIIPTPQETIIDIRRLDEHCFKNMELLDWDVVSYHNGWVEYKVTDSELPTHKVDSEHMPFIDYTVPLDLYRIDGYPHCVYGSGEAICDYVCPRGQKPTLDNLEPFDTKHWDLWGMSIRPHVYDRKGNMECKFKGIITRNGQVFEELWGIDFAELAIRIQAMIYKLKEPLTPFSFSDKNYQDKIVGTKCEYRGRPCTITSYIEKQNCVMLDIKALEGDYDEGEEIKTHIFSDDFNWYPGSD